MKIAFADAALADSASFRHLTALAWLFADLRHQWIVPDIQALRSSAWLGAEGVINRRTFAEMAEKAARKLQGPEIEVGPIGGPITHDRCWRVPADLAEKAAREPLVVLVENARCDGAFLQKVVLRVGRSRLVRVLGVDGFEKLRNAWRDPLGDGERISVDHGGGSTIAPLLRQRVEQEPRIPRRFYVLVDSDRNARDAPLGSTAGKLEGLVPGLRREHGPRVRIELQILRKREVENYLPEEALRAFGSAAFEEWQRWSSPERDFGDLKKHFGERLWSVLCDQNCDSLFHESSLRRRSGDDELDELVGRVAELI